VIKKRPSQVTGLEDDRAVHRYQPHNEEGSCRYGSFWNINYGCISLMKRLGSHVEPKEGWWNKWMGLERWLLVSLL